MEPVYDKHSIAVWQGDCLEILPFLPSESVDCVVTDPPYAEVDRPYGRLTETEWHKLMDAVIVQSRRVLKPTGSAMFVLQPNFEVAGRMRPWLWDFLAKYAREWGQVQDAYWWNFGCLPCGGVSKGLMRGSVKIAAWFGPPDCYRNQDAVLWTESEANIAARLSNRADTQHTPSGHTMNIKKCVEKAAERGGVTPFNLLPLPSRMTETNSASTPYKFVDWWVRYICPPQGTVLDPFLGFGTTAHVAYRRGMKCIGIEKQPDFVEEAVDGVRRLAKNNLDMFRTQQSLNK